MNAKDVILTQLGAVHDQSGWFVSLKAALSDISEEEATRQTKDDSNSIEGIVHHLIYYNERYLHRVTGVSNKDYNIDSIAETFANLENRSWSEAVQKLDQLMNKWKQIVAEFDSDTFEKYVPDLTHLTIHNAYHIGQMVEIRKQQGSWDARFGIR
ncbi:putative damage-inducible protein DinB [Alkalihalobacillus xiaoxiensis]|uniref:Damage-inducible protein DinB n=1 Tax=Shouchella xiaoxiensis TaxID=766895 RepID=A0ABS2SWG1_9BACI|nr:DinB family protein [Shouchella xiaoxiensis]MBM7839833.1 putative damage-inducible protein DinB [Shouchella xiaoxiensis]